MLEELCILLKEALFRILHGVDNQRRNGEGEQYTQVYSVRVDDGINELTQHPHPK